MTVTDKYLHLKEQIYIGVAAAENGRLLTSLKEIFKENINSPRRFEAVSSTGDLLRILEIRDLLSEYNLEPLKLIAKRLPNRDDLLNKITHFETASGPQENVNYISGANDKKQTFIDKEPYEGILKASCHNQISKKQIQLIFETIIEETGSFWRDLGRNLKIRECEIEDIDKNCKTLELKAQTLMERFLHRADVKKWFMVLCEALEKTRRCDLKRKIEEHMTKDI